MPRVTPSFDVLVVDDQPAVAMALTVLLEINGLSCRLAADADEAVALVEEQRPGILIQDMNFSPGTTSGEEGMELFRRLRAIDSTLPVLLITAWTSVEQAVELMKEGASDYLAKPWDDAKLMASVRNLLRLRHAELDNQRLRAERQRARDELAASADLCGLVYESEAMQRVVSLAVQVAPAPVPVLITGPNGSGKEKIAEVVHANSRRRDKPLVKVNVGALPDELLVSELFGAEAGAYTGSTKLRIGRFEAADQGTLFLDEIGNLSMEGQKRLLRVVQEGEFERLGSNHTRRVDVRLVCATNVDLKQAIADGSFREDLFFRLNVIELRVQGLSQRSDDILPLAESFLAAQVKNTGREIELGDAARRALMEHPWPGSVRELSNGIQRAVLVARESQITPIDLGLDGDVEAATPHDAAAADPERQRIERLLVEYSGSVARTAEALGVSRQALYRKMDRLGIVLERRPRS